MSATKHANLSLDLVRGVAALLVVLSHARLYTHIAVGIELAELPSWARAALAPTAFGKESVALFFFLSGFLVGGQVVRQVRRDRFDATVYAVKRLSRFWTVLIPGLVLTAAIDWISRAAFGDRTLALTTNFDGSPLAFVCNAVFLQQARCASFGSNDALWSLSYELWFYVLFAGAAVAVASLMRRRPVPGLAGLVVAFVSVAAFGLDLLALIPAWLIGVGVAVLIEHAPSWLETKPAVLATPVFAVAGMVGATVAHVPEWTEFIIVGVAAAPMIAAFAIQDPLPRGIPGAAFRFIAWIGGWSFSLYVFHLPMVKLAALAIPASTSPAVLVAVIYILAAFSVVCVYPAFLATENHTARVRDLMLKLVGRGQPSHPKEAKAGLPTR